MKGNVALGCAIVYFVVLRRGTAFDCTATLQDTDIKYISWPNLERCIGEVNSELMTRKTMENVWRLVTIACDGIENIPPASYKALGFTLTAIPLQDLRNVSMARVEVVEAFGAIRTTVLGASFNDEQAALIAHKVAKEWRGKSPRTYSEYDLISLGEIICHLSVRSIDDIHVDAFKAAAEWIGKIEVCPQEHLKTFARLAVRAEAFGPLSQWSKLEVSIIGNIINGFAAAEIATLGKERLHLNRHYKEASKRVEPTGDNPTTRHTRLDALPDWTSTDRTADNETAAASSHRNRNRTPTK